MTTGPVPEHAAARTGFRPSVPCKHPAILPRVRPKGRETPHAPPPAAAARPGAEPSGAHAKSPRLNGIEALRGVAAVMVVLSHAARHVDKAYGAPGLITAFQAGHAGVDLFFVISGFIILHVHARDIGVPSRLMPYLGRRAIRVLPLYWIALAVTVALEAVAGHRMPSAADIVWSAAILPANGDTILGVSWTLQYEAIFYLVFGILIVRRRIGLYLLAAWLAWILAAAAGLDQTSLPQAIRGVHCLEFFLGMAVARLLRGTIPRPRTVAALGALLFIATLVQESRGALDGVGTTARLLYGAAAACLVLGTAAAEQAGAIRVPAYLRALGGASYSIYLFQFTFIGGAWFAWRIVGAHSVASDEMLFLALTASATIGGILIANWVEQPILRRLRNPQPRRPWRSPNAPLPHPPPPSSTPHPHPS